MKKVWIGLIILILIGAGGYFAYTQNSKKAEKTGRVSLGSRNNYTVRRDSLAKSISASGNLAPVKERDLVFSGGGTVKSVHVKTGDRVTKGQLLASLDNLEDELNLTKARTNLEQAKINESPSVQEQRKMELQIAEKQYQNSKLTAPFSGLITSFTIEPHDQVSGSGVIGHIIDDSRFIIELLIDETDIFSLKVGQTAKVRLDSLSNMELIGALTSIGSIADTEGGVVAFPVTVEVPADNPLIKSGLSASVDIVVAQEENVLVVPITSVIQRGQSTVVMKMVDGKPTPTPVKRGISNDSMVVIAEGLEEGDQIVLNNSQVIQELRSNTQGNNNRGQNVMMPGMPMPTGGGGRR